MENNKYNVMVKMFKKPGDPFITVSTYQQTVGHQGDFLVPCVFIEQVISGPRGTSFYDSQCGSFAEYYRHKDQFMIQFTWLTQSDDGYLNGFCQTVGIPIAKLIPFMKRSGNLKSLYHPEAKPCTIDHRPASATIRKIKQDKQMRRAFSKVMRVLLTWHSDTITLYSAGGDNLCFTTKSEFSQGGWLILQRDTSQGYLQARYVIRS